MKQILRMVAWIGLGSWTSLLSAEALSQGFRIEQHHRQQQEALGVKQQQRDLAIRAYQEEQHDNEISERTHHCLPYSQLRFRGVNAIDHRPFLLRDGQCISEASLNQISRAMTAAYLNIGLVHTPFRFEETDRNQLVMVVNEGRVRKIVHDSTRVNPTMLFPGREGGHFYIQDLDQALDQANKMAGSHVTVDVLPTSNGLVDLHFVNQEKRRVLGRVALNNFAAKSHHRWQTRLDVSVDSPFRLSDTLNMSVAHTLKGFSAYQRFASLQHAIPYGYWRLNSFASISQFRQSLRLPHQQVEQRGRHVQGGIGLEYVARRGSNYVTTLSAQLTRNESKNRFADVVLLLQSPKLTAYQVAANHVQYLPNGAVSANVSYKHGLPWFNALPNRGRDQPEGQYAKWQADLYGQFYHRFGEQTWKQSHRLQGQYSRNYLTGSEQADLTGRYAVRGLNEASVSAENSLVLRNQLAWLSRWKQWQFSPYLAWDIGYAKHRTLSAQTLRASGYALGLEVTQAASWQAAVEWASGKLRDPNTSSVTRSRQVDVSVELDF